MRVDIHVHTSRHSNCGVSSPEEMIQAAIASGLDALVFTEHDYMWTQEELSSLQGSYPEIKLFQGIEVSLSIDEHMVVIGVPDAGHFYPFMSPAELRATVRSHGGAAILAHPFRWTPNVRADILEAGFDAIEIYSNSIRNYMQAPIRDLQAKMNLPLVALSDGHHTSHLGLYALDLARPAEDEKDLALLIAAGEFNIWTNPKRIQAMNSKIADAREKLAELIENGTATRSALRQVGLSSNLAYAIENNMDILFPQEKA